MQITMACLLGGTFDQLSTGGAHIRWRNAYVYTQHTNIIIIVPKPAKYTEHAKISLPPTHVPLIYGTTSHHRNILLNNRKVWKITLYLICHIRLLSVPTFGVDTASSGVCLEVRVVGRYCRAEVLHNSGNNCGARQLIFPSPPPPSFVDRSPPNHHVS